MTASRFIKALTGLCFMLITAAALSAWNSPATGYESSIYWSTPPLVWGCLIFSIVCGIAIIVHQVYRRDEHSNIWVTGLVLLLLSNTIIISLPIIRGYAMWNASGDTGTHLGIIQDIISTGHFTMNRVWHPITHIQAAQFSQILNNSPESVIRWIPAAFTPLYVVFTYFLAKAILHKKFEAILATAAIFALTCGSFLLFVPNTIANMVFPMTLFFLFRSFSPSSWQWRVLFIFMLLVLPLFHEIPTVAIGIIIFTVALGRILYGGLSGTFQRFLENDLKFSLVALVILIAWSAIWLTPRILDVSQSMVPESYLSLSSVSDSIIIPSQLPEGSSHATTLITNIEYAQYYGYSVVQQFLKLYGATSVYLLLTLIALPLLWRRIRRYDDSNLVSLYIPLLAFALLMTALYFTSVYFGPARFVAYAAIISAIFTGFILYRFVKKAASIQSVWVARISAFIAVSLLVGVSVSSMLAAYPSPYTLSASFQNTQTEIDGMDFFLHKKDASIYSAGWNYAPQRYAAFLLTPEEIAGREDLAGNATSSLPFHLGYDKHSMMGEGYGNDTYVIFKELNRRTYVDLYPGMAELRLLPSDLIKMENDSSVDKLYDNSGMDIWYVHASI